MAKRNAHHPQDQRDRRYLRRGAEERGHRRRRAFVHVRRPHMERHGRDLERQARHHEHHADDQPSGCLGGVGECPGNLDEIHAAGETVDQRNAIEQQSGGQRPQDEILQTGLRGPDIVARERRQHIERQRLQFEPQIEAHHRAGRHHDHHAGHGQQHQHRELEPRQAFGAVIIQ